MKENAGLFYFKCEKCGAFQPLIDNDSPELEDIPHIEYPEKYTGGEDSIMMLVCEKCYNLFIKKWTTNQ